MKIFADIASGNCYKVKLTLELLNIEHDWLHIDILKGEASTSEFLKLNPNGKIPVLQLDSAETLSESNAIIDYLAEGTTLLPTDRLARARVLEWQFFEQYSHEPYIAVARFINKYLGMPESRRAEFEAKKSGGIKALKVMESQLVRTLYLAGDHYTTADVSLYAYTHVAHEGGFNLSEFPRINEWMARIQKHPRHVTMQQFLK
jgi:glutathione S-transferase